MDDNPVSRLNRYELRHLPAHLLAVGRLDDLHRLLRLGFAPDSSGRSVQNAWFSAKDAANELAAFAEDVELAWRSETENDAAGVPIELRYLLMTSSVRTMTVQVPDALILALVEREVWSPDQGFSQAWAHSAGTPGERWERALLLARILRSLEPDQRRARFSEVRDEARELAFESQTAEVLWELVSAIPEPERGPLIAEAEETTRRGDPRAVAEVLPRVPADLRRTLWPDLTRAFGGLSPELQEQALQAIAPHLTLAEVEQAIALTRQMPRIGAQGPAVAALAARLPQERRLRVAHQEFHELARGKPVSKQWADRLTALCPVLPRAWTRTVLRAAAKASSPFNPALVLAVLAPALDVDDHRRGRTVRKAISISRRWGNELLLAEVLASIARAAPKHQRAALWKEAMTAARALESLDLLVRALRSMAPHLEPVAVEGFLEATRHVRWCVHRAELFRLAAATMPRDQRLAVLREALDMARSADSDDDTAAVIEHLAPDLPQELLDESLDCVERFEGIARRSRAIAALAPHLDAARLRRALAEVRAIVDGAEATRAIVAAAAIESEVAPHLWKRALSLALAIRRPKERASALTRLGRAMPDPERTTVLADALGAARAIASPYERSDVLTELAGAMDGDQREAVLVEALDAIRRHDVGAGLDDHVRRLAALAPPALLEEALRYARSLNGPFAAHTIAALVPYLPADVAAAAAEEALRTGSARFTNPGDMYYLIGRLAPHLPAQVIPRALNMASGIDDTIYRRDALSTVAERLSDGERRKVFEDAKRWLSADEVNVLLLRERRAELEARVYSASGLTTVESEALLDELLLEDADRQAEFLPALIPLLNPDARARATERAFTAARSLQYESQRAASLVRLAAVSPEEVAGLATEEALRAARASEPFSRCDALLTVAAVLGPEDRERALAEAVEHVVSGHDGVTAGGALAESLARLAGSLSTVAPTGRLPLALRVVRQLARFERPDVLRSVTALLPALLTDGVARSVVDAIWDVECWWP